eukprot:9496318-Pyramimonas_sp.AAC.1
MTSLSTVGPHRTWPRVPCTQSTSKTSRLCPGQRSARQRRCHRIGSLAALEAASGHSGNPQPGPMLLGYSAAGYLTLSFERSRQTGVPERLGGRAHVHSFCRAQIPPSSGSCSARATLV